MSKADNKKTNNFLLARLISSKICHDIISPATSLQFAMESISGSASKENNDDAIKMAKASNQSLVNRVTYFRMALGAAPIGEGKSGLAKAKNMIFNLFREKDVSFLWSKENDEIVESICSNQNIKVLLNVLLVIFYSIPKNAEIKLFAKSLGDGSVGVAFQVEGNGVRFGLDTLQAINMNVEEEDITARNVQTYYTASLAKDADIIIEARDSMNNSLQVSLVFPAIA